MGYWFVASLIGIMPTWISSKFFRERRVLVSNSSNKDNIDNYINEGGRERVQIEENEGGGGVQIGYLSLMLKFSVNSYIY